ncbi:nicotinate-nucleotide--dimethylbenzimidazole phosphoribosyltransferase [Plebeiibacterium sediminum]|uniref:Nicotinate-nucleotide--dimethylbenzimidazole phosphoribosyltransferase n=1 Tax=Plebeiibacterium sediminum TaxID=2992112 RepID=A0AAE3M903_9BACT|nr:nicotinate-nucleotide--dimethylbenzimidazole phosphoribosyltransferase [Plebeiobacterium sediminum]MCW3789446.1 nicotinate-nucleotide--dimethylbenzimidazole phosphoribosyltransferase [Plebeiobacterium sediminum]
MIDFNIKPLSNELDSEIKYKIDHKTKPLGSLGLLEKIAYQICRIQETTTPELSNPHIVLVGSDHAICEEGVSPCPQEITWQQMLNFANGGGGIGLFSNVYNMKLKVVDAGVNYNFSGIDNIVDAKIKNGSGNFLQSSAMTLEECNNAIANGAKIVSELHQQGCNVVGFGEMGIGNTSPASVLMHLFCNIPLEKCVGAGSGLDKNGVSKKLETLQKAVDNHPNLTDPIEILAQFGGLEIATIAGGMLKAAELKMLILNDGFIITSALLAAQAINSNVMDYVIHSHHSKEGGHALMMEYFKAEPVLNLDLRLGEGTGAAIAYPIIQGAVAMINNMTSFEEAEITDTTDQGIRVL